MGVCFLGRCLTILTPSLLNVMVVHLRGYGSRIGHRRPRMALRLGGSGQCSKQFRSLTLHHLFGTLNMHLAGKRFAPDADMKQAATSRLLVLDTDVFYRGM